MTTLPWKQVFELIADSGSSGARLLPVIDLLDGQVVHAVRGERQNYRPVSSVLCESSRPGDVARALVARLDAHEVYIADLDAIQSRPVHWEALAEINRAGLRFWLDAGVAGPDDVQVLLQRLDRMAIKNTSLVVGLESWLDPNALARLLEQQSARNIVFSLDLRGGVPVKASADWPDEPHEIAQVAHDAGLRRLLVLDLAQVGSSQGPSSVSLCSDIKARWPHMQLACGGGVRNGSDCQVLASAGCDVVLVATALHSGLVTSLVVE